jgi:hypothetical protein
MTARLVAVLARPTTTVPQGLAHAMFSDVIDLVADTAQVDAALAVPAGYDASTAPTWPGTPMVEVAAAPSLAELLIALAPKAAAVAVVAPDAPDLPTLMFGKLFSALAGPRGASLSVCPADGGGLVAAAATTPVAGWLEMQTVALDDRDALDVLRAAAPPRALSVVPGWHRIRGVDDTSRLDAGLEGWDATRAYLS